MAMVIKRSGKLEPFDEKKIKNTLATASDEVGTPLSLGDIKCIIEPVLTAVKGSDRIASKEIYDLLIKRLGELGFWELAKAYQENSGHYRAD